MHTDESRLYGLVGGDFTKHETIRHAARKYVRGCGYEHDQGRLRVLKRGIKGLYQHCGEQHFQCYINEFAFCYYNRSKLGIEDDERALIALRGIEGKRLTYRRISGAENALGRWQGIFQGGG